MPDKAVISHRGEKYEIGRGKRFYGIWVVGAPYDEAKGKGLWKGTAAARDLDEYWVAGVEAYFHAAGTGQASGSVMSGDQKKQFLVTRLYLAT